MLAPVPHPRQDGRVTQPAEPRRARPAVRAAYLIAYGLFAALGAGLLAPPAILTVRGLGLFRPALTWSVPLGWLSAALLVVLSAFALRFALAAALGGRARFPEHAAFLALLVTAFALRLLAPEPAPPPDPSFALATGLRVAAESTDAQYEPGRGYSLAEAAVNAALAPLPTPGFASRARALPLRARVLRDTAGPQQTPLLGDPPGTIYLALSADKSRCWLTAVTLRAGQPAILLIGTRPAVIHARGGTHSAPDRDPLLPSYPSARAPRDVK